MAQVGINTGLRHARVLGWAKSYTRNLDDATKTMHDIDIVGAAGLIWNMLKAALPRSMTKHVEQCLKDQGLPRLATQHVGPGAS